MSRKGSAVSRKSGRSAARRSNTMGGPSVRSADHLEIDDFVDIKKIGNSIKKPSKSVIDDIPIFKDFVGKPQESKELQECLVEEIFNTGDTIFNYGKHPLPHCISQL